MKTDDSWRQYDVWCDSSENQLFGRLTHRWQDNINMALDNHLLQFLVNTAKNILYFIYGREFLHYITWLSFLGRTPDPQLGQ
jgi:hypothetical protein